MAPSVLCYAMGAEITRRTGASWIVREVSDMKRTAFRFRKQTAVRHKPPVTSAEVLACAEALNGATKRLHALAPLVEGATLDERTGARALLLGAKI